MIEDKSKTLPKVRVADPKMDRVDPIKVAKALGADPASPDERCPVVIHRKRKSHPKPKP
jgi:hypothetical protein